MKITLEVDDAKFAEWQAGNFPRKPLPHKYAGQAEAQLDEKMEREAIGRTQGRKGCRAARINMAFYTENYKYLRRMARIRGVTMTEFCNTVIEQHRQEHGDIRDFLLMEAESEEIDNG